MGYELGGLYMDGLIFRILQYVKEACTCTKEKKIIRKKDSADKLPSCCKQTSEHPKNLSQP